MSVARGGCHKNRRTPSCRSVREKWCALQPAEESQWAGRNPAAQTSSPIRAGGWPGGRAAHRAAGRTAVDFRIGAQTDGLANVARETIVSPCRTGPLKRSPIKTRAIEKCSRRRRKRGCGFGPPIKRRRKWRHSRKRTTHGPSGKRRGRSPLCDRRFFDGISDAGSL